MVHPNYYNKKPTNITGLVGFDFNATWDPGPGLVRGP